MLINRPEGNFNYVPGHDVYCSDVLPHDGYQVAHATFTQPIALVPAFAAIQTHLAGLGRPITALCGMELRIANALTFDGFGSFNAEYIALLNSYGLRDGNRGTMTRTNVAPEMPAAKPKSPSVYGFSYIVPGVRTEHKSFVCSGSGELAGSTRETIVKLGDISPEGLREKARWVMQMYDKRLPTLGLSWADVTNVNLYCVHSPMSFFVSEMLDVMGAGAWLGVHWHYTRPPIVEIEFEADVRGTAFEVYL
ncbi:MAG: hypothetical protein WCL57_17270 [Chloroflexota bacterium]|jgi:enamine deaminase RidA (YjgF/YER057c/UK114 family)|nr:hypothetical protein [Chloroflexota bacterium]